MLRRGDYHCYEICWPAPQVVQFLKFEDQNNKIEGTLHSRHDWYSILWETTVNVSLGSELSGSPENYKLWP
jgi:hypothetical protein